MRQWSYSSNYPTDPLLFNFENVNFEWNQERAVLSLCTYLQMQMSCCSPPLFQNRAVPLQLVNTVKKHLFGFEVLFYVLLRLNGQIRTSLC